MLLWIAATIAAYFVKGMTGFANTLVFTSILAYSQSNAAITPIDLLTNAPANAMMAWRFRKEANWRVWLPMAGLMFVGIIPGVFFLKNVDARMIKLGFGVMVVLLGVEMLLREISHKQSKGSKPVMLVIGILSGILCGLYGVGALLAAYFSRTSPDSHSFKGSLSMVFLLENLFRVVLYSATGVFTWSVVLQALKLIPFMVIGLLLGMKSASFVSERTAKRLVMAMLIVSGIALFVTNL